MKLELHWKIIIGLVLGLIFGVLAAANGWGGFTTNWIAPFGIIFINLLKLIAVPLVLSSLITGVASLSDLKKLSRIGGKTITIYIVTTTIAVTIGLVSVNLLKPGDTVPEDMKVKLQETYKSAASGKLEAADQIKERRPLQPIVDMVPSNFFSSASNNRNMLQVVFVAIIIGIALIQIPKNKARPVLDFMEGINDLVIKLVDNIMLMAPIGVFALIADTITSVAGDNLNNVLELLSALGFYMLAVIIGLFIQMVFTYTAVLKIFSNMSLKKFYQGIAQPNYWHSLPVPVEPHYPLQWKDVKMSLAFPKRSPHLSFPLGRRLTWMAPPFIRQLLLYLSPKHWEWTSLSAHNLPLFSQLFWHQ